MIVVKIYDEIIRATLTLTTKLDLSTRPKTQNPDVSKFHVKHEKNIKICILL